MRCSTAGASRFHGIHLLLIPGAIVALIGARLYLVTRHGRTAPPWLHAEKGSARDRDRLV